MYIYILEHKALKYQFKIKVMDIRIASHSTWGENIWLYSQNFPGTQCLY